MQWYKHSTGSHDDPDISDAMDEFGQAAYTTFFITLEIYGSEYNHLNSDGWLNISQRFLSRKLRISWTKAEQIINFYSDRGRILIKTSGIMVSINCPKFIDIASNWTKRKGDAPTEDLQRDTVVPTAKEEKKKRIEEEGEEKKNNNYSIGFMEFWNYYPRKVGKLEAWKAWKKHNGSLPEIGILKKVIDTQKNSPEWMRDNGQYIPHPTTWLNQGRWEDEKTELHPLAGKVSEKTIQTINGFNNWRPPNAE